MTGEESCTFPWLISQEALCSMARLCPLQGAHRPTSGRPSHPVLAHSELTIAQQRHPITHGAGGDSGRLLSPTPCPGPTKACPRRSQGWSHAQIACAAHWGPTAMATPGPSHHGEDWALPLLLGSPGRRGPMKVPRGQPQRRTQSLPAEASGTRTLAFPKTLRVGLFPHAARGIARRNCWFQTPPQTRPERAPGPPPVTVPAVPISPWPG